MEQDKLVYKGQLILKWEGNISDLKISSGKHTYIAKRRRQRSTRVGKEHTLEQDELVYKDQLISKWEGNISDHRISREKHTYTVV